MSYYVMRVYRKTALSLTADLKSVYFDFSIEITMFFRTSEDIHEMYQLLTKYRIQHQPIDTIEIMSAYEHLRTYEKGV